MNNNVAGNLNNCANLQNNAATNGIIKKQAAQKQASSKNFDCIDDSMKCLNSIGMAQVNMDNVRVSDSVKKSLEEYMQNPELIEAYIDFCDSLVKEGYCLKDAVDKTDGVFEILHNEETYKD